MCRQAKYLIPWAREDVSIIIYCIFDARMTLQTNEAQQLKESRELEFEVAKLQHAAGIEPSFDGK